MIILNQYKLKWLNKNLTNLIKIAYSCIEIQIDYDKVYQIKNLVLMILNLDKNHNFLENFSLIVDYMKEIL